MTDNLCYSCASDGAQCSCETPEPEAPQETGSTTQPDGERDDASVSHTLLYQRRPDVGDINVRSDMGPSIGEGELAVMYFINWHVEALRAKAGEVTHDVY